MRMARIEDRILKRKEAGGQRDALKSEQTSGWRLTRRNGQTKSIALVQTIDRFAKASTQMAEIPATAKATPPYKKYSGKVKNLDGEREKRSAGLRPIWSRWDLEY